MKFIVIADHHELDTYESYMQAIVDDGKEYSPAMEFLLEGMQEARRHPEHVETESDGFSTVEVQTTETGGCEFRVEYDSETICKMIQVMTDNRDIIEQIVKWLHGGLKLFSGVSTMFKELIGLVNVKKEQYALEQESRKEVVW